MKRFTLILAVLLTALASPATAGDNALWGTAIGASLGGLVGSTIGKGSGQLAATGAGVFLGGAIGNSIGHSMDRSYYYSYAPRSYGAYTPNFGGYTPTYVAPPAPPPPRIVYVEPQTVEYHYVTTPTYVEQGYVGPPAGDRLIKGKHCREFTQTIKIDGRLSESYGTACLRPDGTWQIVP